MIFHFPILVSLTYPIKTFSRLHPAQEVFTTFWRRY